MSRSILVQIAAFAAQEMAEEGAPLWEIKRRLGGSISWQEWDAIVDYVGLRSDAPGGD